MASKEFGALTYPFTKSWCERKA